MNTKPFTYLIGWPEHQKFYYGVRFAQGCNPKDLMTTYFTSSRRVQQFIEEHGLPSVVEIRKTFDSTIAARRWEEKVLFRMKVIKDPRFLNKTTNRGIAPECAGHAKGKTYEEIYGEVRGKQMREKRAASNKARRGSVIWSSESKRAASVRYKLGGNPRAQEWKVVGQSTKTYSTKKEAAEAAAQLLSVRVSLVMSVLGHKQRGIHTSKQHASKELHKRFYIEERSIFIR